MSRRPAEVLDASSGRLTCAAGHTRPEIAEAISRQAIRLYCVSHFGPAHPRCFEKVSRLTGVLPGELNRALFTCSGLTVAERRHIDALCSKQREVLDAL